MMTSYLYLLAICHPKFVPENQITDLLHLISLCHRPRRLQIHDLCNAVRREYTMSRNDPIAIPYAEANPSSALFALSATGYPSS
jgi:hypothetical protein